MKLNDFFSLHPVFTFAEIAAFLYPEKPASKTSTIYNLLTYHQKQDHIRRVRQGLYCTVPAGIDKNTFTVDPFLIASKLTGDAILGYRTALDFFGNLHSVQNEFIYLSQKHKNSPFIFQDASYRAVSIPIALENSKQICFAVKTIDRLGQKIKITSLERTIVDVLDRPYLCGSWEEIWLSLESIEYLNLDEVVQYALLLGNATTVAKVGYYLENHKNELMVSDFYLSQLAKHIPKTASYLDKKHKGPQVLMSNWNLFVPNSLHNRKWEEPNENI
ncbi:MAG: hypothetical protein LLF94_01935 [Chlamydiales bacterium]|nr:hypothetical protein [Chlamydiales bacterium]